MAQDDKAVTTPFEENLQKMLTRAYEPLQYRQAFYDSLLERLKTQQRQTKSERTVRRVRHRRYYVGALASLAAAAAIALAVAPLLRSGPVAPVVPDLAQGNVSSAPSPEPVEPASSRLAIRFAQVNATNALECRENVGAPWKAVVPGDLVMADRMELRLPESANGAAAALKTEDATALSMQPGTRIRNQGGRIVLDQGGLHLAVSQGQTALGVQVEKRDFDVMPGSEVYFKAFAPEGHAQGGVPAPRVMVMTGAVCVRDEFANRLPAGYLFTLYDTVNGCVPGVSLEEKETVKDFATPVAPRPGLGRVSSQVSVLTRERGREVLAIGEHLFVSAPDGLVEAAWDPSEKAQRLVFASPEYAQLAQEHSDVARAAALGSRVVIKIGGQAYEIVKQ
jgi:hypothetical protein